MNLYHYTLAHNAVMILRSGVLKTSTHGLMPNDPLYTWFSKNQVMERTATHFDNSEDIEKKIDRLFGKEKTRTVRFRYIPNQNRMIPWTKLKMRWTLRRQLEARGRKWGACSSDWFGFPGDVLINDLQLEDRVAGVFVPVDPQRILDEFDGIRFTCVGVSGNTTRVVWSHEGEKMYVAPDLDQATRSMRV